MNKVVIKGVAVGLAFAVAMGVAYKGDVFKSKADKVTKTKVEMTSGETEGKIYDYEVIPMNTRDRRSKLKINLDDIAIDSIDDLNNDIIDKLKNVSDYVNENNIDDVLCDALSEVDCDVDIRPTINHAIQTGEIPTGSEVVLEVNTDESELSEEEAEEYQINEDIGVSFFDNGIMAINYLQEGEVEDADELIDEDNEYNETYEEADDYEDEDDEDEDEITRGGKGIKKTTLRTESRYYDLILHNLFAEIDYERQKWATIAVSYIKAQFTCNKKEKKCTAKRLDWYTKKGISGMAMVTIDDQIGGVIKKSKGSRIAYQQARIVIGFEWEGMGISRDVILKAGVGCNYKDEWSYHNRCIK